MIRPIVKDILFLQRKAEKASRKDSAAGRDLLDTLAAHSDTCVGLAANMIGASKAIIAIRDEKRFLLLYNPVITKHSPTSYDTEEGCLSLAGKRPCRRYDWVEVKYEDEDFHKKRKRFQGFTAEIIQHEIDHLEGILI
ncbi:peptide deformylase [uncultured Dialister sp.]|uniref:peptide deformylase n=1 Tax=uncultured Dialister sp. TaxID=278064 RepID=UPI00265A2858|nr:peptide deformylase [uncultured Dialister sp.]